MVGNQEPQNAQLQLPPSADLQLEESGQSILRTLAIAITVAVVALSVIVLFLAEDALFYVLFYSIPIGSLVAIGLAVGIPQVNKTKVKPWLVAINLAVFACFALWHFLDLGLGGDPYPCLVDAGALAAIVGSVVLLRRMRRSDP